MIKGMVGGPVAGSRIRVGAAVTVLVAFVLALVVAAPAMAAKDPLKGGKTTLKMKLPKKVKVSALKPAHKTAKKTVVLPIKGGKFDPTNCSGNETLKGGMKFKYKGRKVKVKALKMSVSHNAYSEGSGKLSGKIGKKKKTIASLSDGTCSRNGFGAKLTGVKMKLNKGGKKALNRKLSGKPKKPFKKRKFGSLSTQTVPRTVQVTGGDATLDGATSQVIPKLVPKGVDPATGGLLPVAPATFEPPSMQHPAGQFHFPVTGGTIAPNGSDGTVNTSGGIKLTKTQPTGQPTCDGSHPVGISMTISNIKADLPTTILTDDTVPNPTPPPPTLTLTGIPTADLTGKTVSSNASTRQVTVSGGAALRDTPASTLNQVFGTAAEGCGTADVAAGDSLGSVSLSVNTH